MRASGGAGDATRARKGELPVLSPRECRRRCSRKSEPMLSGPYREGLLSLQLRQSVRSSLAQNTGVVCRRKPDGVREECLEKGRVLDALCEAGPMTSSLLSKNQFAQMRRVAYRGRLMVKWTQGRLKTQESRVKLLSYPCYNVRQTLSSIPPTRLPLYVRSRSIVIRFPQILFPADGPHIARLHDDHRRHRTLQHPGENVSILIFSSTPRQLH